MFVVLFQWFPWEVATREIISPRMVSYNNQICSEVESEIVPSSLNEMIC